MSAFSARFPPARADNVAAMNLNGLSLRDAFPGTFEALIGTVYDSHVGDELAGHFELTADLLTAAGGTPLGLYATVAEGAASMGTAHGVQGQDMFAAGMSNDTTVTQEAVAGRIDFRATLAHKAADMWLWSIGFSDATTDVVALSAVHVAVRPMRLAKPV
jgi:hypothetical protein